MEDEFEKVYNFEPYVERYIHKHKNNKIYKTVITSKIINDFGSERIILTHKFHIGTIDIKPEKSNFFTNEKDLKYELFKYIKNKNQQFYFFTETTFAKEEKELPLYMGAFYFGDTYHTERELGEVRIKYINLIQKEIDKLLPLCCFSKNFTKLFINNMTVMGQMAENLHSSLKYQVTVDKNGEEILFIKGKNEKEFYKSWTEDFNNFKLAINDFTYKPMKTYWQEVLNSIYSYISFRKICKICEECKSIMKYSESKKYCGEECSRRVSNRKAYQKRKTTESLK